MGNSHPNQIKAPRGLIDVEKVKFSWLDLNSYQYRNQFFYWNHCGIVPIIKKTFQVEHLRFLEDGQFAKIYKGNLLTSPSSFGSTTSNYSGQQNGHAASGPNQIVSIKVPRVPEAIRKEKSN